MFIHLNHQNLEIFKKSRKLVSECYKVAGKLPSEEKFVTSSQLRRAALSVYLTVAEGCSRKSLVERKRYFEISRGSLIEIDAIFDVVSDLNFIKAEDAAETGGYMLECLKMLSVMIKKGDS